jgi:mono/diheme cytochrome c family protein
MRVSPTATVLPRLCAPLLCALLWVTTPATAAGPQAKVAFNRDVRPILSDACFHCHGPDRAKRKADLRLDTEEGAFGDRGGYRPLVPGKPDQSELYKRITAPEGEGHMPPKASGRKLTSAQIDIFKRWIEQGARWQKHWALIPPARSPLPSVKNPAWVRNGIDRFILARLEKEGLTPAPEADRTTLIRRVTLDLIGLPPTPAEVDAFLADTGPDAYERLVDRLLSSPRHGERMVLEWLDAARYADSNGYQGDRTRSMWPWRDQVVRALNANQPFDQFTIEQLAGDLIPGATIEQKIASGFNRNHVLNGEGGRIAEESRVDYVVDRVNTTSTVWLGLTVGCAQCHDHKYDPIPQKDFYRLSAYFNNIAETGAVDRNGQANPVLSLPTPKQTETVTRLEKTIAGLEMRLRDKATDPERKALQKQLADTRKKRDNVRKSFLEVMVMQERTPPRETFVLIRGAYDKHGDKVTATTPAALHSLPKDAPANRLGLARWLVSRDNPLTARVTVNRYWQIFFGTGLVKTAEDLGVQGEPPSHPELLDWLAREFMRSWDVKAMHRLIVTSATYRQSSRVSPELLERDPDNRLLARGSRHRLPSLILRDQALALSGLLVERLGGPPVKPYQPEGVWAEMSFGKIRYVQDHGPDLYRRSLYTFWRRTVGPTDLFDTAARQVCTVRQPRTNTPLHALTLWNDVTYAEAARVLAERVMTHGGRSAEDRVTFLFRLATARLPHGAERQVLLRRYQKLLDHYRAHGDEALKLVSAGEAPRNAKLDLSEHAAWTALASLVLNLDEVLSKE